MSYWLIIVIINIDWTGQSFEKKENENKICEKKRKKKKIYLETNYYFMH